MKSDPQQKRLLQHKEDFRRQERASGTSVGLRYNKPACKHGFVGLYCYYWQICTPALNPTTDGRPQPQAGFAPSHLLEFWVTQVGATPGLPSLRALFNQPNQGLFIKSITELPAKLHKCHRNPKLIKNCTASTMATKLPV